jgi:hypothetical protein
MKFKKKYDRKVHIICVKIICKILENLKKIVEKIEEN